MRAVECFGRERLNVLEELGEKDRSHPRIKPVVIHRIVSLPFILPVMPEPSALRFSGAFLELGIALKMWRTLDLLLLLPRMYLNDILPIQ